LSDIDSLAKNRHGMDSHGSAVLFKPTRGPMVTLLSGTKIPASILKLEADSVKLA
jgi:hypothetical protein